MFVPTEIRNLRQPKILHFKIAHQTSNINQNQEVNADEKIFIENHVIPKIYEIGNKANQIQEEISVYEGLISEMSKKKVTSLYDEKIRKEIVLNLYSAASLYNMDVRDEFYSLFFPFEAAQIKKKWMKGELEKNNVGQKILDDEFGKKLISNFALILDELKALVIK